MKRFIKGDEILVTVSTPTWIKMQSNGYYGVCDEKTAQGVVIAGTPYHIEGLPTLDGAETIQMVEISETDYQLEQTAKGDGATDTEVINALLGVNE